MKILLKDGSGRTDVDTIDVGDAIHQTDENEHDRSRRKRSGAYAGVHRFKSHASSPILRPVTVRAIDLVWLTGICRKSVEGGGNTAAVVRNASEPKPHFDAAECSSQHQVVEAAEVSDAKYLVGKLGQACTERHVKLFQDNLS